MPKHLRVAAAFVLLLGMLGCSGSVDDLQAPDEAKNLATGIAAINCIGDLVWLDENCNGCQDKDEPGLEGVVVVLYDCKNDEIDRTTTDEDGYYSFIGIEEGDYYICVEPPKDCEFSPKDACSDDADSDVDSEGYSDCFTIGKDDCRTDIDVGICCNGDFSSCTPGYWKNHLLAWEGYDPGDYFDDVMGCAWFGFDITLLDALKHGGGDNGPYRMGRHGTAALLNAAHSQLEYPYSVDAVKTAVCAGETSMLADANEDFDCGLGKYVAPSIIGGN